MYLFVGPQLDWDPDIVDALNTAEATSNPEEELEDDFILLVIEILLDYMVLAIAVLSPYVQANEGQSALPVYVMEVE